LHGLTRVRGFTQDAHIFVPEQLDEEFKVIDLVLYVFGSLGFENFTAQISLRDKENREKYIGSDENWEKQRMLLSMQKDKKTDIVIEYGKPLSTDPLDS
jgi:threonyl-tRNA synthetase